MTFLNQHLTVSHFKQRIMDDYAADVKKKKCSLCQNGFENGARLIVHIGATHKICQEYLKSKPKVSKSSSPTTSSVLYKSKSVLPQKSAANAKQEMKPGEVSDSPKHKGSKAKGDEPHPGSVPNL